MKLPNRVHRKAVDELGRPDHSQRVLLAINGAIEQAVCEPRGVLFNGCQHGEQLLLDLVEFVLGVRRIAQHLGRQFE